MRESDDLTYVIYDVKTSASHANISVWYVIISVKQKCTIRDLEFSYFELLSINRHSSIVSSPGPAMATHIRGQDLACIVVWMSVWLVIVDRRWPYRRLMGMTRGPWRRAENCK